MSFSNSIIGGAAALIRAAIKSPNYVPGSAGWSINKDGSAEFSNLTLRGTFNGNDFIIGSSGIFFYNGAGAAGNPPIFAVCAPGITQDPFGNTVSPVLNIGPLSAAHAGFDNSGVEYLADSTGTPRIVIDPGQRVIEFLSASGLGSTPLLTIASAAGTDSFGGGAFPAGINLSGLPLQAGNTIVNTNGVFTYSALPPAAGGLLYSSGVAAAFTDSAGNAVLAGETLYGSTGSPVVWRALNFNGGVVSLYSAASEAGPWNLGFQIFEAVSSIGQSQGTVFTDPVFGVKWFTGAANSRGSLALVDPNGSAAPFLYGAAPNSPSTQETWHDLRPLINGFVGSVTGEYPPQYMMSADGWVNVHGTVQLPPSGGYNGVNWSSAIPAAYRPNKPVSWPVSQLGGAMSTDATAGIPRCFIDSGGQFNLNGLSSSINGTNVRIDGRYPLDATGVIQS